MKADPEVVLAWMRDHDATSTQAGKRFGVSPNTLRSWVRRAREREAHDDEVVENAAPENRLSYLRRSLSEIDMAKRRATAGQLPGLVKQGIAVHADLTEENKRRRALKGEFEDPAELVEQIVVGLEAAVHLLTADQVVRVQAVAALGGRLTQTPQEGP